MRCQDVEIFVKSLYMRQIGRLATPSTHQGVDLVMAWVNRTYGHLRMGKRLLVSNCDWLRLPTEMPQYWRNALKSMGTLRGLKTCLGCFLFMRAHVLVTSLRCMRGRSDERVRVGLCHRW